MCFLLFLFSLIMYQFIKHIENKTKNWTALLLVVLGPQNYCGSPLSWPLPESLLILILLQFAGLWLPPKDISSPVYLGFLFSNLLFFCQWFSVLFFFRKMHTVTNTVPSSSKLGSISWVFYPPSHHSVSIPPMVYGTVSTSSSTILSPKQASFWLFTSWNQLLSRSQLTSMMLNPIDVCAFSSYSVSH